MLQIENLHVCVEDQPILNGLSLEINAGQVHAIMGPNGSGKSTLANYLKDSLFKRGYKGTIIDGDTIRDRDKQKLSYGFNDVLTNNIRIASLCEEQRTTYDFVLVPVISPYEEVRKKVRKNNHFGI